MSNLTNKHLPSDIDSLTRKNLVEIYHIQVEEYQKLQSKCDALERHLENLKTFSIYVAFHDMARKSSMQQAYDWLAIRDLEQQAIGVEKAADVREINWASGDRYTLHLLAKNLRKQAEALKSEQ